jgi:hypothetical protein
LFEPVAGYSESIGRHPFESDIRNAGAEADNANQNQNFANNQPHGNPSPCAGNFPASPHRRRNYASADCLNSEFPLYGKDKFSGLEKKNLGSSRNELQNGQNHEFNMRALRNRGPLGRMRRLSSRIARIAIPA